jgi:hypothetical protein
MPPPSARSTYPVPIGVQRGLAMDSLKYCLSPPFPAGGPPLKQLYGRFGAGLPATRAACGCLLPYWTPPHRTPMPYAHACVHGSLLCSAPFCAVIVCTRADRGPLLSPPPHHHAPGTPPSSSPRPCSLRCPPSPPPLLTPSHLNSIRLQNIS